MTAKKPAVYGMFCSQQLCCQRYAMVKDKKTGERRKQYRTFKAQVVKSLDLNLKNCPDCGQMLFSKKLNPHDLKEITCQQN